MIELNSKLQFDNYSDQKKNAAERIMIIYFYLVTSFTHKGHFSGDGSVKSIRTIRAENLSKKLISSARFVWSMQNLSHVDVHLYIDVHTSHFVSRSASLIYRQSH